ncbi:hypothetical protein FSP39_022479 [Pinctada imbricata]|uniref:RNA ligase 1 n=1 Tax=Pinctada imbricata TaxID=66713 RepID=A0AA89C7D1_PINIB|nr:hypothetical protein FSP39_022479 [Pinctada imbricata]
MNEHGKVQQKISCIFETSVLEEPSSKRSYQPFRVVASNRIRSQAIEDDISVAKATEKLDGTCCYIAEYQGKPWLWARLDRKPNKAADKKFKKFSALRTQWEQDGKQGAEPVFEWNFPGDFKEVPEEWIPALGVPLIKDQPVPDSNGHIPGWVPVDPKSRQHLWHLSAVDLTSGLALILREESEAESNLLIELVPLSQLVGCTLELIGTNVNANPYGLGNKKSPLHVLVVHGCISLKEPPPQELEAIREWFQTNQNGCVEGIVWHCNNRSLYKLHRHHLNLPWPLKDSSKPSFSQRSVKISVDSLKYEINDDNKKSVIWKLSQFNEHICEDLCKLNNVIEQTTDGGGGDVGS